MKFNEYVLEEIKSTYLGEMLGCGASRTVYECKFDSSLVVKVETGVESFDNILEWEIWQSTANAALRKWLAPCVSISTGGVALVQKRTTVLTKTPTQVPACFTDLKEENMGMFEGRPVFHDYAFTFHFALMNQYGHYKLKDLKMKRFK